MSGAAMKFFIGDSEEQCSQEAQAFFGCGRDELAVDVLQRGGTALPWVMLAAPRTDWESFINRPGRARLLFETDGVYFELIPPGKRNPPVDENSFMQYIQRKKLRGADLNSIHQNFVRGFGYLRIGPPQEERICDEELYITVSKDEMDAYLELEPPDPTGAPLTLERAREQIRERGVVYGVDEDALSGLLEKKLYGRQIHLARGTAPQPGMDGRVEFHFRTEHDAAPRIVSPDGKVDYRNLDLFEKVTEGQLLVTRYAGQPGTSGYTVRGRELKGRPGREARMPGGKNVYYDEERFHMYAKISGMVEVINQTVVVSGCYRVQGNCDLSVGNIDFDGDVLVTGVVTTGMTIRATGSVEIFGVSEGAHIIAGGNVFLRGGMQGVDKGMVEAGADVVAKYLERACVRARGKVTADVFVQCRVESEDSIQAQGKHGSIIGGEIKAQNEIVARSIGTSSESRTIVEVGMTPGKRARFQQLVKDQERLKQEIEKYDKTLRYLAQLPRLSPDRQKLQQALVIKQAEDSHELENIGTELERLTEEMDRVTEGKVHVTDMVYPGVLINICRGKFRVTHPTKFATFRYREGEVEFTACQI